MRLSFILLILLTGASPTYAAELTEEDRKLLQMSPDELLGTQLTSPSVSKYWEEQGTTSVTKKGEDPFNTPAAIYIISSEDIRRSGVTSVMEALRMAPGVQVARIDSNKWAISIRGFNRQFSDKLRVMIDGRPIYTNLFSGVFWDDHDIPIEEIERIEVIRGSGGVIWGINAFNGIINIITKHTKDSQGNYVSAIYGTDEQGAYARNGGMLDEEETGFYRSYAKISNRDATENLSGNELNNGWRNMQSGFRLDKAMPEGQGLYLKGDIFRNEVNDYITAFPSLSFPFISNQRYNKDSYGGNLSAKWSKPIDNDSSLLVQSDISYLNMSTADFQLESAVYDLDIQHFSAPLDAHELIWGLDYRFYYDAINNSFYLSYTPDESKDHFLSGFVQDKIWLIDQFMSLTFGMKIEHYDETGVDYQPSIRLTLHPDAYNTFWVAASRLTKFPTRGSLAISRELLVGTPSGFISGATNQSIDSDKMLSYEAGYRTKITEQLSIDFATFYNDYYDDLYATRFRSINLDPDVFLTAYGDNGGKAHSYGFEAFATWQTNPKLRIEPGYSFLITQQTVGDLIYDDRPGFPRHQITLRSQYDLSANLFLDTGIYYVSGLRVAEIPDYTRLDTRLAWKPISGLELSLVGQNLLDDKHQEYEPDLFAQPSEIGRSVYVKAAWEF